MAPFNFRVALDLTAFFEDFRSKCYIYVDVGKIRVIEDLEKHIKDRFGIKDNIFFCTNDYYIPSSESIDILHTNEILKVCQKDQRIESNDSGIFGNLPKGGKTEIKKKKKSKKIQTNPADLLAQGVLASLTCNSSFQFECGDLMLNVDSDSKGKTCAALPEQEERLREGRMGRKRRKSLKHSTENESPVSEVEKKDASPFGLREEVDLSNEKQYNEQPTKKRKRNNRQEECVPEPSCSSVQLAMQEYRQKLRHSDEAVLPYTGEEATVTPQAQEEVRECNGNLSEGELPMEECSAGEYTVFKRRRKRTRHRKKRGHYVTRQSSRGWNSGRENVSLTPIEQSSSVNHIQQSSSVNHIRFCSDDETEKRTAEEVPRTLTSVPNEEQQPGNGRPKPASVSKWDEKPTERRYPCPQEEDNSGLTLDEVWDKTLPILRYQSSTVIFDCPKTELPAHVQDVPQEGASGMKKDEIITEDGSVKSIDLNSNMTSSPLEGLPRKNDVIAFKMFRLSEDYTPVLSNHITARVLEYDGNTFTVKLQILKGHEELAQPKGRFCLDDQTEQPKYDTMELNWNEMLDPLLIFP